MVIKSSDPATTATPGTGKALVTQAEVPVEAPPPEGSHANNDPVSSPPKPGNEPGKARSPQFDAPGAPTPHPESMKHQFTPDAPGEERR